MKDSPQNIPHELDWKRNVALITARIKGQKGAVTQTLQREEWSK
jgi:hypothetical protein